MKQRQTNLFEFLDDLIEATRQELYKETGSEDTTETESEFTSISSSTFLKTNAKRALLLKIIEKCKEDDSSEAYNYALAYDLIKDPR